MGSWCQPSLPGGSRRGSTQPEGSLAALPLPTSFFRPRSVGTASHSSPVPARGAKPKIQKKPTGKNLQVTQGTLLLCGLKKREILGEASGADRGETFKVVSNQVNAGNTPFSGQQEEGQPGSSWGCRMVLMCPSQQPWDAGQPSPSVDT